MTTYIHPDNPFFGGMEQVVLALIIFYLIGMLVILVAIAFVIKVVFTAIFGKSDDEERTKNNPIETEEASDDTVVDNSAQPSEVSDES